MEQIDIEQGELGRARVRSLRTIADAHIVATHTTEATRRFDFNAAQSHRETILAMKSPGGSLYDLDFEGEPVTFKSWRELVTLENDPMWGNQYVGPFAGRGTP